MSDWSHEDIAARAELMRSLMLDTAATQFQDLQATRATLAAVTAERDRLAALWEEVGQHLTAAAIGYNAPQVEAVFSENLALRRERVTLAASFREVEGAWILAKARIARLVEALADARHTISLMLDAAHELSDPSLAELMVDIIDPKERG
jgi:hypothetical protein